MMSQWDIGGQKETSVGGNEHLEGEKHLKPGRVVILMAGERERETVTWLKSGGRERHNNI